MCACRAPEIGEGDLLRRQRHGGAEVGAHRPLAVRRDEREAAPVGDRGALEARAIAAGGHETPVVLLAGRVGADLAEVGRLHAEPAGAERGVGRGAAGLEADVAADLLDEPGDVLVVDEHHAALGAGDMGREEGVVHVGEQVHDGIADTDQVKGGGAHCGLWISDCG